MSLIVYNNVHNCNLHIWISDWQLRWSQDSLSLFPTSKGVTLVAHDIYSISEIFMINLIITFHYSSLKSPTRETHKKKKKKLHYFLARDCREKRERNLETSIYRFPDSLDGKASACNARDPDLIHGLGRSPGEGNGNPLQYSCLENFHGLRSLVGYSPWGSQRVRYDWATSLFFFSFIYWDRLFILKYFSSNNNVFETKPEWKCNE